jgi:hypothetical protein
VILVIWKFKLRIGIGEQRVEMPAGSRLLTVQAQGGAPTLWALCDERAPKAMRRIWCYGTGDALLGTWPYIATLQLGTSVVHYFDHGDA